MISVIIPNYNNARWLGKCLSSVIGQKGAGFEVIVVDDGSTDGSWEICQSFAGRYGNVTAIRQANGGPNKARLTGIGAAKGDYVWFMDSDDWMTPGTLAECSRILDESPADMLLFSNYRTVDRWGLIRKYSPAGLPQGLYDDPARVRSMLFASLMTYKPVVPVFITIRCFRKDLLQAADIACAAIKSGEDRLFLQAVYPQVTAFYVSDHPAEYYRYGGITNRYYPDYLSDRRKFYAASIAFIEKYGYDEGMSQLIEYMIDGIYVYVPSCILARFPKEKTLGKIEKEVFADPFWDGIAAKALDLPRTGKVQAFLDRDAERIYAISRDMCKWRIFTEPVKRFISRL